MLEARLVVVRCCARWLLGAAAVTGSAFASALGLGDITLHSALNQPLRAEIALVDAAGLEEGELSVSLATADEFNRAGVERVFFLNDLKFTPILRGNRSVIQVTSRKAVNEPFLNFLVQLNQPNGRLLREFTVLIDPPGTPGIEPLSDDPVASRPDSAFPTVKPATAPASPRQKPAPQPAAAPAPDPDPLAEQLAASVLQNQQLQATIDELNGKLQTQDEQIAIGKKQVTELQSRLAEIQQAPEEPVAPVAVTPPVVVEESAMNWPLIVGLLTLLAMALLALFVRRRRQQATNEAPQALQARHEPVFSRLAEPMPHAFVLQPAQAQHDDAPPGDVLEAVGIYMTYGRYAEAAGLLREAMVKEPQRTDLAVQLLEVLGKQGDLAAYEAEEEKLRGAGFDGHRLQEIRTRQTKLTPVVPLVPVAPVIPPVASAPDVALEDEFQLNLDELSMDANWDLVDPLEPPSYDAPLSIEPTLPEPEIEWEIEPASQSLDDSFLDEFREPGPSLELEPLNFEPSSPTNAGKLEQAQTCIDDGDLDSAIELLNELLKEGDERLQQTARHLLAGIR